MLAKSYTGLGKLCYYDLLLYRDLKAENVLVASDLTMRLMDFGLSKLVDYTRAANNMTAAIGTSIYMAPELTLGQQYDSQVVRTLMEQLFLFYF